MDRSQKGDRATDDHMDNMVVKGNSKQRDGESRPLGGGTTIKEMSIMKYCAINTIWKDISASLFFWFKEYPIENPIQNKITLVCKFWYILANDAINTLFSGKNLHSWHKFYTTADRDKSYLCWRFVRVLQWDPFSGHCNFLRLFLMTTFVEALAIPLSHLSHALLLWFRLTLPTAPELSVAPISKKMWFFVPAVLAHCPWSFGRRWGKRTFLFADVSEEVYICVCS